MGIQVLPPDLNSSAEGFGIEGNNIRFGLSGVKGLGSAVVSHILEARPFESIEDIIERVPKRQLNKRALGVLAHSGALDSLSPNQDNRMATMQMIHAIRGDKDDLTEDMKNYSQKEKLDNEHRLLGIYVSGHPLDDIAEPINWDFLGDYEDVHTAGIITSAREFHTKTGQLMSIVNVDTLEGDKKLVLYSDVYEPFVGQLKKELVVKFTCYTKYNPAYDERSIIVKKFTVPKRINKHLLTAT